MVRAFSVFCLSLKFPIKKYLELIEGRLIDKKDDIATSRNLAGLKRFTIGLMYLATFTLLQPKVKGSFLATAEYDQKSFFYKLCYAIATTKVNVMKYQAVWLIAEGSCIITGLGYNGRSTDGRVRWDGCSNVHLLLFECAYTFQHVIDAFNLKTNQWMFRYLYKRLRFLGNKLLSHFLTLAFVALWHGIEPGFFLCFIGEFAVIVMEQQLLGFCRRVIRTPFEDFSPLFKIPIILLGVCLRLSGVAFFLVPFLLRRLDLSHKAWLSLYYIGPVVVGIWFVLYPFALKPLARVPKIKSKDPNENKLRQSAKKD